MRSRFDAQLEELSRELIEMGALIESAIETAVDAFIKQDRALAIKAIAFDSEVDQKEKEIENMCLKLLLQQQPIARDLRLISSALKMITDMERIGDQAGDISELTILLSDTPYLDIPEHIQDMARATIRMVNESIDAFVRKDLALANEVIASDDIVDTLFNTVKAEVISRITYNSESGEQAIDIMMVAKYFERIGDHATNIAEWVVFSLTGDRPSEQPRL